MCESIKIDIKTMGIKNLNTYIKKKCSSSSIQTRNLFEYRNKKIVVDASIYLYKYSVDNELIENMYTMITIFRKYNIFPVFVFDGKPCEDKQEIINKRKEERWYSKQQYSELLKEIESNKELKKKYEIKLELEKLKRKSVKITRGDIGSVKELLTAYGIPFIVSPEEADGLCAYMVLYGIVDACLSDDTDMFMYNCSVVLQNINLVNETVLEYNTNSIFHELNITNNEFVDMMVLKGTDYNICNNLEIGEVFNTYNMYKKENTNIDFYNWLINKNKYEMEISELEKTKSIFNIDKDRYSDIIKNSDLSLKNIDIERLNKCLTNNGFIIAKRIKNYHYNPQFQYVLN